MAQCSYRLQPLNGGLRRRHHAQALIVRQLSWHGFQLEPVNGVPVLRTDRGRDPPRRSADHSLSQSATQKKPKRRSARGGREGGARSATARSPASAGSRRPRGLPRNFVEALPQLVSAVAPTHKTETHLAPDTPTPSLACPAFSVYRALGLWGWRWRWRRVF